jgi:eukaryotic-like serine/threonine-protein kinase
VSSGRYEVVRKLASGGMAEVFLARSKGPQGFSKTLVLKQILPHLAEDESFVQMFLAEAKIAALLSHPNIVQIFDFGELDGAYFLAMEYVEGVDLRRLCKSLNRQKLSIPPEIAARIFSDVCQGLEYAHEFRHPHTGEPLNLVHRDLSPDNILVSTSGSVKLLDFGIAKAGSVVDVTRSRVLKGKYSYMSPEQIRGETLDARSDLFSLGIVLYELLTGRKPFVSVTGDEGLGTMNAVLTSTPAKARELRPDLPPALEDILKMALAKPRDGRYQTCRQLQEDLDGYLLSTGRTTGAREVAEWVNELEVSERSVARPKRGSQELEKAPTLILSERTERPKPPPKPTPPETLPPSTRGIWTLGVAVAVVVAVAWWALKPDVPPPVQDSAPPSIERPEPRLALPTMDGPGEPNPPQQQQQQPQPKQEEARDAPLPTRAKRYAVELRIRPYAEVWIDGKKQGETPLPPIRLTEGKHLIRLRNEELKKDLQLPFIVGPGKTVFRHNLAE